MQQMAKTEYFGYLRGATPDTQFFISPIPLHHIFKIGTDKKSDLILDTNFISSLHCKIHSRIKDGVFIAFITDTSLNGTYINGVKIGFNETVVLYPNSIIQFASRHLKMIYLQSKQNDINDYYQENFSIPLHIDENKKKYVISVTDKSIGSGKQGDVLLSHVVHTQRFQLACKKYRKNRDISPATEIEMLKNNKHINVLSIIREFEKDGFTYAFSPLYMGGTLTQRIESNLVMTEKDNHFIFYQILSGLQYIHQKGIIHCDVKADNILLAGFSDKPRIIIADFGLSIYSKPDNKQWPENYGTLVYHSPEMLVNKNSFTEKVDCWAAGVILYQMFAKKNPFINASFDDPLIRVFIKESILNDEPNMDLVKDSSSQAQELLLKLLTKDPDLRYSVSDCLNSNWIQINCDKAFHERYQKIHTRFIKERAFWFEDEQEIPEKKKNNITYHVDNVEEDVAQLKARRAKREDDQDCIFCRGVPFHFIHPYDAEYINTQLDVGREWKKRKLALGDIGDNDDTGRKSSSG